MQSLMIGVSWEHEGLLREARTAAGLSQAKLARKCGVTQSVISVVEETVSHNLAPLLEAVTRLQSGCPSAYHQ